ncbi:MAG: efflux RND transporter periplasmic adaptor subunit [Candidatus Nealsonbacteria bacterium]
MKTKKILLISVAVIVISFVIYNSFLKKEEVNFTLIDVVRGNVVQEVSETGQVQQGEEIKLNFKTAGTIEQVYVKVGQEVWPGSPLAKLDTNQLSIELNEDQYALKVTEAKLNQILAGTSPEEIQAAQTDVDNAQVALEDAKAKLTEDVNQAYDDALNTLDNAYLKGVGAFNTVRTIQITYFPGNDQESTSVKNAKANIENSLAQIKISLDEAKTDSSQAKTNTALSQSRKLLSSIYDSLNIVRNMTETSNYQDIVSSANKTALNTDRININQVSTNLTDAQQDISSAKLTNQTKINAAEGDLKVVQDALAIKKAGPRQTDINYYQAQVEQARAVVDLLETRIKEATLRSPVRARISEVNKKTGETVQPASNDNVIVILPTDPYDIKVDIYEEDVVKVKLNDPVDIKIPAFPNQVFPGKVILIDPAEKIIEGVIYYGITINFENPPQEIKPGMSADITVKTAEKHDVLTIPGAAVEKKDNKTFVQIFKDEKPERIEIQIGLSGINDAVEVVSGLNEGDQVAILK